jgi:hypothetical protein
VVLPDGGSNGTRGYHANHYTTINVHNWFVHSSLGKNFEWYQNLDNNNRLLWGVSSNTGFQYNTDEYNFHIVHNTE